MTSIKLSLEQRRPVFFFEQFESVWVTTSEFLGAECPKCLGNLTASSREVQYFAGAIQSVKIAFQQILHLG
jgi:hypothetical protein